MNKGIALGLLVAAGLLCGSAQALNLSGEWKLVEGNSQGALSGQPAHINRKAGDQHITGDASEPALPFVLTVTSQKGNSFHGKWCGPKKCEKTVGVIRKDGTILMADDDSTYLGTMYGSEMELCVTQHGKALRLAVCHMIEKK